jgi:2-polyprenyl-6-methoxyphenol hydroxylase-like FAD-dependent oxidoreductase
MAVEELQTNACIVGGGPAGMMLGYLLAREGIDVTVIEKHADFLRDFRGDTVHPSTLQVLHELDLLDDFLKLPHQRVYSASAVYGGFSVQGPDFRNLPAVCGFIALMPQWDFLNFLAERAKRFPSFSLHMQHEAVWLGGNQERFTGVMARRADDTQVYIHANLVVACDGRHSITRAAAHLKLHDVGAPIDVLWFRLDRVPGDPEDVLGNLNYGKALILINRGDSFQAGMIIRKGSFEEIQGRGIDAFRHSIVELAPFFGERVDALKSWDQIKLLTVQINRLQRWYRAGLLCIGDAAHAMSPAGGVGINLAIQDAVAAANLLTASLRSGYVPEEALARVQARREFPARLTQAAQVQAHKVFEHVFANPGPLEAPWQLKLATRIPGIHCALGYAVGIGVRPEHVRNAKHPPRNSGLVLALGVAAGVAAAFIALSWRRT